jgi:methyl-accepting chemotaxis protein
MDYFSNLYKKWCILNDIKKFIKNNPDARTVKKCDYILEVLLKANKCEFGYILKTKQNSQGETVFEALSFTNISWDDETRQYYQRHMSGNRLIYSNMQLLYGKTFTENRVVIMNDVEKELGRPLACPKGHMKIQKYIGIPIYNGNNNIGALAFANGKEEFSMKMVDDLNFVLNVIRDIIIHDNRQNRRSINRAYASSFVK